MTGRLKAYEVTITTRPEWGITAIFGQRSALQCQARVVASTRKEAAHLFGMSEYEASWMTAQLLTIWEENHPEIIGIVVVRPLDCNRGTPFVVARPQPTPYQVIPRKPVEVVQATPSRWVAKDVVLELLEATRVLYTALERSSPAEPGYGEVKYRLDAQEAAKTAIKRAEQAIKS